MLGYMIASTVLIRDLKSLERDERRAYVWGGWTGIRYSIRITGRPVNYCGEWLKSSSAWRNRHLVTLIENRFAIESNQTRH